MLIISSSLQKFVNNLKMNKPNPRSASFPIIYLMAATAIIMSTISEARFSPSTSPVSGTRTDCEYNWTRHGTKCYLFLGPDSAYTFDEARYECRKHYKATLVTVKSDHDQQFIESMFKGRIIYNNIWIGAKTNINYTANYINDDIEDRRLSRINNPRGGSIISTTAFPRNNIQKQGNPFIWINDGTKVTYTNRLTTSGQGQGEYRTRNPNSTLCMSMVLVPEYFGIWSPYDCNYYFNVLCEKSLTSSGYNNFGNFMLFKLFLMSISSFVIQY